MRSWLHSLWPKQPCQCQIIPYVYNSKLPHLTVKSIIDGNHISSWSRIDAFGSATRQLNGWRNDIFNCNGMEEMTILQFLPSVVRAIIMNAKGYDKRSEMFLLGSKPLVNWWRLQHHLFYRRMSEIHLNSMTNFNNLIQDLSLVKSLINKHRFT